MGNGVRVRREWKIGLYVLEKTQRRRCFNMYLNFNDLNNGFEKLFTCADFIKFQNKLSEDVYKSLNNSYANKKHEIAIVEDLCNSLNAQESNNLHIYAEKIHGAKSYVDFPMQGKVIRKELADMVILSIITRNKKIVYEKTAFIQNKKESKQSDVWSIDKEQLFLLQNFPTFSSNQGIFRNSVVTFLNSTGSLGNYGLFKKPGEMIVSIASEVTAKLEGNQVRHSRIAEDSVKYGNHNSFISQPIDIGTEIIVAYRNETVLRGLPFLQNISLSINVYEFIRNLTQFNIGEPILITEDGKSTNGALLDFNRRARKRILPKDKIPTSDLEVDNNDEFEGDIAVLCVHLELDEKYKSND
jgi:hypothetical protein